MGNHYIIDADSAVETTRLELQARLTNELMGFLLPPGIETEQMATVLDIGCGPGTWVLDVAFTYPHIDVAGIDISKKNVDYALARARSQGLTNASFEQMDALEPLDFAAATFDVVNLRYAAAFMKRDSWALLLKECMRILKPGGFMVMTEGEWPVTTSAALHRYLSLLSKALCQAGQSLSTDGQNLGMVAMLGKLLRDAGFVENQLTTFALDFSFYNAQAHQPWFEDLNAMFILTQPFLLKHKLASQAELANLYGQFIAEMWREDFCAVGTGYTAWGKKPEPESQEEGETENYDDATSNLPRGAQTAPDHLEHAH